MRVAGRSPAFNQSGVGTCIQCGKVNFRTRKEARAAKRAIHPGEKMDTYQCFNDVWHYGHTDMWLPAGSLALAWTPLPAKARAQVHAMARDLIGAAA